MKYTSGEIFGAIKAALDEGQIEFVNVNRDLDKYSRFIDLYTILSASNSEYKIEYTNKKDLTITVNCEGIEIMLEIEDEAIIISVQD